MFPESRAELVSRRGISEEESKPGPASLETGVLGPLWPWTLEHYLLFPSSVRIPRGSEMDWFSLPLLNPLMIRSIGWCLGPPPSSSINSLLFLKLLLCREASEMRLGRDHWVTILLARVKEDRERNLRQVRLRGTVYSGDSSQTKPRIVNQELAQVPKS